MAEAKEGAEHSADVPSQLFEKFLEALTASNTAPEVVARLRKVLLVDKQFSERAIKPAIFPPPKPAP